MSPDEKRAVLGALISLAMLAALILGLVWLS